MTTRVGTADVQNLLAAWWYAYDEAELAQWPDLLTTDARFSSRSDSGASRFEAIVTREYRGREVLIRDLGQHRIEGLYPVRHLSTNMHVISAGEDEAEFRAYLLVTRVEGEQAVPIATGRCAGIARREAGRLKIATLEVVFDLTDSRPFAAAAPERSEKR